MELIRPAIEGTERALNAGLKAGVERIVLTSSMAAIAYGHDRPRRAVHRRRLDRSRGPRLQRLRRVEDPRRAARLGDHEGGGARGRSRRDQPERHLRSAARRGPRHFGAARQTSARRQHARRAALQFRRHRRARRRRRPCRGADRAERRRPSLPDGRAHAVDQGMRRHSAPALPRLRRASRRASKCPIGGCGSMRCSTATCAAISASSAWCGGWIRATSSRCSDAT